jgi:hypothetical protein
MNNTVTQEQIDRLIEQSEVAIHTVFGKTTVVSVRLKNGFVFVESSSCVDPSNYNEKLGAEICLERIKNKLWEMEGYLLQETLYRMRK